jgi:ABC-2 type transport system ATP-binding protein
MTHLLEAVDLIKTFPGIRAVDGVSFNVGRGQCFGLLGPNGAGKTTTMEMLEGISKPRSGEILYQGRALDRGFREEIGIQFQSTALQDFQTVRESLHMFTRLYRQSADIDELIGLCNLEDILDRDTRKLSGGQRQRLLLAIALVNDPKLVFLDEPTTGLDPQARRNFWGLIEMVLQRGKTVVLTTHYMEEAQQLCDDIVIIDKGRIIASGEPVALVREHLPAVIARLPANAWPEDVPMPENSELRNGFIEMSADEEHELLDQLERSGANLGELKIEAPNLEDLFLKLTGHALRS